MNHASFLACVTIALAAGGSVQAADTAYPTKPITLVVPFPPGGATDIVGRIVGKAWRRLGQTVISTTGPVPARDRRRRRGPGRGRWLHAADQLEHTFTVNPALRASCPTTRRRASSRSASSARSPLVLLATRVPANNVKELVALRQGRAGQAPTLVRQRHHLALRRRDVQGDRRADPARALQGQRAGDDRPDRRAGAARVRHRRRRDSAAQAGKVKAIAVTRPSARRRCPRCRRRRGRLPRVEPTRGSRSSRRAACRRRCRRRLDKALADTWPTRGARPSSGKGGVDVANGAASSTLIEKELPLLRAMCTRRRSRWIEQR